MPEHVTDFGVFIEGDTGSIEFTITDQDGTAFTPDDLYVTIYDEETGTIINGRNGTTDIKATAMTGEAGEVVFNLTAADCVLLNTYLKQVDEVHRAMFKWTWVSGSDTRVKWRLGQFTVKPREGLT